MEKACESGENMKIFLLCDMDVVCMSFFLTMFVAFYK